MKMETRTGILNQVEKKVARNGSEYWCLHIDDKRFNTFDPIFGAFKTGGTVEYKIDKNVKGYDTLIDMKEIDTIPTLPLASKQSEKSEKSPFHAKGGDFHLTIEQVRSNALDCAIKVTKKLGTDDYAGDLMHNAVMFEKYILTGEHNEEKTEETS